MKANCSHPLRNVAGRLTPVTRWGVSDNGYCVGFKPYLVIIK